MKEFGLLGYPLGHSLSPQLHKILAQSKGNEMEYRLFCKSPEEWQDKQDVFSLNGFNVTIPYKVSIIPELDQLDLTAQLHGAVNVVSITPEGKKIGYNTDCIGFIKTMQAHDIKLEGKVCILGAGGVGRMFAAECAKRGCEVTIAVREQSLDSAEKVLQRIKKVLPQSKVNLCSTKALQGKFHLLINATPCGMYPHTEESPISEDILQNCEEVFDCIYNPRETLLLKQARKAGCKAVDGLEMLCWQAAAAQEIWMGEKFTTKEVSDAVMKLSEILKQ